MKILYYDETSNYYYDNLLNRETVIIDEPTFFDNTIFNSKKLKFKIQITINHYRLIINYKL